jgi:hypothetical protein
MSTQIELMQRMNSLMQQQLEKLTSLEQRLGGQAGAYSQLQESVEGAAGSLNDTTSAMEAAAVASKKSEGFFGSFVDTFKDWNKSISESLTKHLGPLQEGLKLLGVNFESLTNIISDPLGAAFGFLRAGYDFLIQKAAELIQKQYELANAFEKVRDKFGSFNENTSRRIKTGYQQFSGALKDAAGNSTAFASKFAMGIDGARERLEKISELAGDLGPIFDALGQQFNNATAQLYVLKDGLGFTEEGLQQTARLAMLSGKSLKSFSQEIMASVDKIGKNFGISTKVLGADVGKALSNFKMLGKMTGDYVKQITQAAVFTRKLGFELTELTGLVDKFDDFEQGAEAAASLAQGFGLVLDPLKMMNMQDPAARLQEVQRAFLATGKSVESMTRQERALLASTSGLDEKILTQALSAKGLSQSYDEIAAGADAASKKQRSSQQVMTDLADNIENVITPFKEFAGFVDAFFQGFARGFGTSGGFMSLLKPLAEGMKTVASIGGQTGKILADFLFPTTDPAAPGGIVSMLQSISDMFVGIAKHVREFVKALVNGEDVSTTVGNFMESIFGSIDTGFNAGVKGFDIQSLAVKFGTKMIEIFTGVIKFIAKQIPKWTVSLGEMFKDPGPGGLTGGVGAAFGTALDGLIDTMKSIKWDELLEALGGALIDAMGRFFNRFPVATLFVTGGPILTVIAAFVNDFFGKIGDIFSSTGAGGKISSGAAGKISGGISDGVTESAAQVVGSSQGLLDRLFNIIEEPAKISAMAAAIAVSITMIGAAVRDVLLSFMEPLPGRDDGKSFIDVVVDSANKFSGVSWQNLMTLGVVLGAVGLGIGAVMFAVSKLASSIGTMGAVGLLVGGGIVAAGLALIPTSAGAKGLLGGLLGGIGDLMIDITTPFMNPMFIASLAMMGALSPQLLTLTKVAETLKNLVTTLIAIDGSLPKKGMFSGGGNDIEGLRTSIKEVVALLAGDGTTLGIAAELVKIPTVAGMDVALEAARGTAGVLDQVVGVVSSLNSLGDIETAGDKIKELAGTDKFIEQLQTLSAGLAFMSPDAGAADALTKMNAVLTQVGAAAATINGLGSTEDGFFAGPGLTTKTKSLTDFMPVLKGAMEAVGTNISGITKFEDADAANINSIFNVLDSYSSRLEYATNNLSQSRLDAFEARVTAIVDHTKKIRLILEDLGTIPLNATIEKLESNMKVAKTSMSINGGAVNVNVSMTVNMNAEKMAGSLVMSGFVKPTDSFQKYMQTNDGFGEQFDSPYDDGYKWGKDRGMPTDNRFEKVTGGSA